MSFIDVIKTIFEFSLVAFTFWAILNENKFIKIERKIKAFFRRRKIKAVKGNSAVCRSNF